MVCIDPESVMGAADDNLGICCPRCGCRHCPTDPFEVYKTEPLGQNRSVQRQRTCRHCKKRFLTKETVIGIPDDAPRRFRRQAAGEEEDQESCGL